MKINKIFALFSALLLFCCPILLCACKDEKTGAFDPNSAIEILDKLAVEDDKFITALTSKYENDANKETLTTLTESLIQINDNIKTFIENFDEYKMSFSSSDDTGHSVFTYDEKGFIYNKKDEMLSVSLIGETGLRVETSDVDSSCVVEIYRIADSNYAMAYYIKDSTEEFGDEILCYFLGSNGRLKSRVCLEGQSKSVFDIEDYNGFAIDDGTGFYFYT